MYSSIIKTKTRPGDYLAILGAGGGLGHMYIPKPALQLTEGIFSDKHISRRGIQIASKKGLKVIAIDRCVSQVEESNMYILCTNLT